MRSVKSGILPRLLVVGLCMVMATPAFAASPLGIGTAEPSISSGGFGGGLLAWVNMEQQSFYRALTGALKAMREDPWKLWTLVGLSFAYGVFHAAGPGHGKAVISSYMIANEVQLKRGILISFVSAFFQGFTALVVVGTAFVVLRGTSISLTNATDALEAASYALIMAFGLWLLYRKVAALMPSSQPVLQAAAVSHDHHNHGSHQHGHHHHRGHAHNHDGQQHSPGEVCETCGHAHMPSPETLGGRDFSLREAFSAVFAVGLRPCSGALIVLTFSLLNGLYLGGILSVLAMSIGTAITVSALAIMAVSAKGVAVKLAGGGSRAVFVTNAIEILGALLVTLLGLILLMAALQA